MKTDEKFDRALEAAWEGCLKRAGAPHRSDVDTFAQVMEVPTSEDFVQFGVTWAARMVDLEEERPDTSPIWTPRPRRPEPKVGAPLDDVGLDYYILDTREVVGNCAVWWCPDGSGYTCDLEEAGLYTLEEASCHRNTDIPVPREKARQVAVTHVRSDRLSVYTRAGDRRHRLAIQIAKAAHEVNRVYCEALGDDSHRVWGEAPAWQRESAIHGVEAIIGSSVTSPEESHASWLAEKEAAGWKFGEVKDPENKTHPCMLPYDDLPPSQRAKDTLFFATVVGLWAEL